MTKIWYQVKLPERWLYTKFDIEKDISEEEARILALDVIVGQFVEYALKNIEKVPDADNHRRQDAEGTS